MPSIIEVRHQVLAAALGQLEHQVATAPSILAAVGEDIVERTKARFASATGPDGAKWRPNTRVTLMNYIKNRGGFSRKTGKILAKGQALAISKRPLQGLTGDLARQIVPVVSDNALTVGTTMIYAAMQQFGGSRARFGQLWGDIPARPFLPITPTGELYPNEADLIVDRLREYLME